jgi:hypothetical protein
VLIDSFRLDGNGAGLRRGRFQENEASVSWRISDLKSPRSSDKEGEQGNNVSSLSPY